MGLDQLLYSSLKEIVKQYWVSILFGNAHKDYELESKVSELSIAI
jgi:hypothetical protein